MCLSLPETNRHLWNREPKIYRNLENCFNLILIGNIEKKMCVGQNVLKSKGKTIDLYGIVRYYHTLREF